MKRIRIALFGLVIPVLLSGCGRNPSAKLMPKGFEEIRLGMSLAKLKKVRPNVDIKDSLDGGVVLEPLVSHPQFKRIEYSFDKEDQLVGIEFRNPRGGLGLLDELVEETEVRLGKTPFSKDHVGISGFRIRGKYWKVENVRVTLEYRSGQGIYYEIWRQLSIRAEAPSEDKRLVEAKQPTPTIDQTETKESLVYQRVMKMSESEKRKLCMVSLKAIWRALLIYSNDFDNKFPQNLSQLFRHDPISPLTAWCPSDSDPVPNDITNDIVDAKNSARISYHYNNKLLNVLADPNLPLLWDNGCEGSQDNHGADGGHVIYLNGHVEWVPADKWKNRSHGEKSYPCSSSK